MPKSKQMGNPIFGKKTAEFLDIAFKDYLAARVLINSGLLSQGAVLSSTAVEKYLKAILAFRGNEARGHLSEKHFRAAINFDARLASSINGEFISLLQRCYSLRYVDNLPPEFNLVIASREFLAELDHTAVLIQESFKIKMDGEPAKVSYARARAGGDSRLYLDNYTLTPAAITMQEPLSRLKQVFIEAEPQRIYEVRNCSFRGLLEAEYHSTPRRSDQKFLREGWVPADEARSAYRFSMAPIWQGDAPAPVNVQLDGLP